MPCIFAECHRGPALAQGGRDPYLVAANVGEATPELVDATGKSLIQDALFIALDCFLVLLAVVCTRDMAREQRLNGGSSLIQKSKRGL